MFHNTYWGNTMSTTTNNIDESATDDQVKEAICLPYADARIAELAYFKAEARGFEPGHELEDWLEAERVYLL